MLKEFVNKFKLNEIGIDKLLLIALAGVILIITSIPSGNAKSGTRKEAEQPVTEGVFNDYTISNKEYGKMLEDRLTELLENMEGVGKVKVMITLKSTSEKVVLTEVPYERKQTIEEDNEGGKRTIEEYTQDEKVIYITDSSGRNVPYTIKEMEPEIEGVAVVAKGADNSLMINNITRIVQALFNVSAHKILVTKMN